MKTYLRIFLSSLLLLLQYSCGESHPNAQEEQPSVERQPHNYDSLRVTIDSLARSAQGRVGVALINLNNGDTFSYNGEEQFAMFSTYKFPLAVYALHLVEQGKLSLDQEILISAKDFDSYKSGRFIETHAKAEVKASVDSMIYYAMSYSDNLTTDYLFNLVGGPDTVNHFIHEKGVREISIANTVMEMAAGNLYKSNWCEPMAMTRLLQLFQEGKLINQTHTDYLFKYMADAPNGLKRLKGLLPDTTIVAHKTGTGGTADGILQGCNDVGIIRLPNGQQLALSVYINDVQADISAAENIIARIAKAVYDDAMTP